MRRLLALALLASLAAAPAAGADPCDPETGQCHAVDCVAWDPVGQAPYAIDLLLAGDPAGATAQLLPPPCPPV